MKSSYVHTNIVILPLDGNDVHAATTATLIPVLMVVNVRFNAVLEVPFIFALNANVMLPILSNPQFQGT